MIEDNNPLIYKDIQSGMIITPERSALTGYRDKDNSFEFVTTFWGFFIIL